MNQALANLRSPPRVHFFLVFLGVWVSSSPVTEASIGIIDESVGAFLPSFFFCFSCNTNAKTPCLRLNPRLALVHEAHDTKRRSVGYALKNEGHSITEFLHVSSVLFNLETL